MRTMLLVRIVCSLAVPTLTGCVGMFFAGVEVDQAEAYQGEVEGEKLSVFVSEEEASEITIILTEEDDVWSASLDFVGELYIGVADASIVGPQSLIVNDIENDGSTLTFEDDIESDGATYHLIVNGTFTDEGLEVKAFLATELVLIGTIDLGPIELSDTAVEYVGE